METKRTKLKNINTVAETEVRKFYPESYATLAELYWHDQYQGFEIWITAKKEHFDKTNASISRFYFWVDTIDQNQYTLIGYSLKSVQDAWKDAWDNIKKDLELKLTDL